MNGTLSKGYSINSVAAQGIDWIQYCWQKVSDPRHCCQELLQGDLDMNPSLKHLRC